MTQEDAWKLLPKARLFALPYYREPQRAYHNDHHIRSMLFALGQRQVLNPTLALAVWGHDLIYNPRAKDNEERSAELFDIWLAQQGIAATMREQVAKMIRATKHETPPQSREEALLVDADLSILGAETSVFDAYDKAIRKEYRHVPSPLYQIGRSKILRGFLERERIFTTPEFADLEDRARANLRRTLSQLG